EMMPQRMRRSALISPPEIASSDGEMVAGGAPPIRAASGGGRLCHRSPAGQTPGKSFGTYPAGIRPEPVRSEGFPSRLAARPRRRYCPAAFGEPHLDMRRGARVVDRGGLENRCTREGTVGSNPTLSAIPFLSSPSISRLHKATILPLRC